MKTFMIIMVVICLLKGIWHDFQLDDFRKRDNTKEMVYHGIMSLSAKIFAVFYLIMIRS